MSELVKQTTPKLTKPKSKSASRKKIKGLGHGADAKVSIDQTAQGPGQSLTEVAVATVAGELHQAKAVYVEAKQHAVSEFFNFVREEQSATADSIGAQVLDHYGLSHEDVFEAAQPAEITEG